MGSSWDEPWRIATTLHGRPWGGYALNAWPHATTVGVAPWGEAWLVGPQQRVTNGAHAGRTLEELAQGGVHWLGENASGYEGFPLLIKVLDAAQPLSIQVHPNDVEAKARGFVRGKTEAWWLLDAAADAVLWWGLRDAQSREGLRRAADEGQLAALLKRFTPRAGDVFVNPAGTIHALGAGLTVYEVQQASDVTYRLDDYGRLDASGRPRALHLDDGVAVATLTPGVQPAPPPRQVAPGRTLLAFTEFFALESVTQSGAAWVVGPQSFEVLSHVGASDIASVEGPRGRYALQRGESLVFPAGFGPLRVLAGDRLARVWVPAASH